MKNSEKIDRYTAHIRKKPGLAECLELMDAGEIEASIKCLGAKIKIHPEDPELHFAKALVIYKTDEWGQAIKYLTDGLKIDPDHEFGLLIKAEILREHGRLEFALKFFNKLINLNQDDDDYKISKAELLDKLGREEEAEEIYMTIKVDDEKLSDIESMGPSSDIEIELGNITLVDEEVVSEPEPVEVDELEVLEDETLESLDEVKLLMEVDELEIPEDETPEPVGEVKPQVGVDELEVLEDETPEPVDDVKPPVVKEPIESVQTTAKQEAKRLFVRGVPVERTSIRDVSLYKEYDEIETTEVDAAEVEKVVDGLMELSELDDNEIIMESLELFEDELLEDLDDSESEEGQLQEEELPEIDHNLLDDIDRVMIMKGRALRKPSSNQYEDEDRWKDYADEANAKRGSPVSSLGIFCIVSIAIYLMYVSLISLYNNLFVDFRTFDMIQNAFIFILGFGALYGSVSVAKNSLVFDHFMDSVFETEVYPRLEPALEEVADVQARLELIEDRLERMNLNIVRYKKYPPVHDSPFLSISNRISMFLKFVIAINVTIGVMLYSIRVQGSFTPYVFTTLFVMWWIVITDEYKLWKNPVSWAWAILPVFTVPVISMLLWVAIDNAILIGLISAFLCLYAYGYFTWSRYYVEGTLPFGLHEGELEGVESPPATEE